MTGGMVRGLPRVNRIKTKITQHGTKKKTRIFKKVKTLKLREKNELAIKYHDKKAPQIKILNRNH